METKRALSDSRIAEKTSGPWWRAGLQVRSGGRSGCHSCLKMRCPSALLDLYFSACVCPFSCSMMWNAEAECHHGVVDTNDSHALDRNGGRVMSIPDRDQPPAATPSSRFQP